MKKTVSGMLVIFTVLVSVSSVPLFGETKEKSLYERLGKKKAIAAVVDEFVARAAGDVQIGRAHV